jgi:hypothetical protein
MTMNAMPSEYHNATKDVDLAVDDHLGRGDEAALQAAIGEVVLALCVFT